MKISMFITLSTLILLLVGCDEQNNVVTVIDSTISEQKAEIARIEHDLTLNEEVNDVPSELSAVPKMIITYDEGHQQLQKVIDELDKHADDLADLVPVNGKGDYIGFNFATYHLYNYMLAINYKGEDLLDPRYSYNYSYDLFDDLIKAYHENVDFKSIELEELNHKGFEIEIELSYKNKFTNSKEFLQYYLNYGIHGLKDLSKFNH